MAAGVVTATTAGGGIEALLSSACCLLFSRIRFSTTAEGIKVILKEGRKGKKV